jgi:phenylalanyl-tRNA synthetase beta chain
VVSGNLRHGRDGVAVFEVGKGYGRDGGAAQGDAREWWRLGIAVTGAADAPAFNQPARPFDLDDAKGLVELVCRRLGFEAPVFTPEPAERLFHPGRTARVSVDGQVAGIVGQLHPAVLDAWGVRAASIIVAELSVAGLAAGRLTAIRSVPPSRHPAVERDLAVVVPETQPAGDVAALIRGTGGPLLRGVALFDIYRGTPLTPGEKSLAHRLTFQAGDRTLTEAEVDAAVASIAAALSRELGGRLRT